jgi:hypothetical protein
MDELSMHAYPTPSPWRATEQRSNRMLTLLSGLEQCLLFPGAAELDTAGHQSRASRNS